MTSCKTLVLSLFISVFSINSQANELLLLGEEKIIKLLPNNQEKPFEASGVSLVKQKIMVVFDNRHDIAQINKNLSHGKLIGSPDQNSEFEGIVYDQQKQLFYVIVESIKKGDENSSEMVTYNKKLQAINRQAINVSFKSRNKGFEGIAYQYINDQLTLFLLCEGNQCKGGKKGKKPGKGRVLVFQLKDHIWQRIAKIKLPKTLNFKDFSGIDIQKNKIAIVSQASSALWVSEITSKFRKKKASWKWKIKQGNVYSFPKKKGKTIYCNIEGVSWKNESTLVFVSDKKKKKQAKRCKKKDQSVHLFRLF
ncbi:MAG: hypothetical protein HON94_15855 [Methylococcales bacterium]|jgi:uncharacterized protein YjiK|nr:hypothetical protein [Methylococcales bacterium]MBT7408183.1 hypothetical protein [Methylococcales bacterium]